jgi:hypothetical protein
MAQHTRTFTIKEDTLTPLLKQLSGAEVVRIEKSALRSAGNKLTKEATKELLRRHPHRPKPGKQRRRVYAEELWDGSTRLIAGPSGDEKRKTGKIFVQKQGKYLMWWPSFMLDWFDTGTNKRYVENIWNRKYSKQHGRVWVREDIGGGDGYRGQLKKEKFLGKVVGSKLTVLQDVFIRFMARGLGKLGDKKKLINNKDIKYGGLV